MCICDDKDNFDYKKAKDKIETSFHNNFYYLGREWPYKNVKPKIIVEKYLELNNNDLTDYKVMCFNGQAKMIFTCSDRFNGDRLKVTFFDLDWNILPFERHYPKSDKKIAKPKNLKKMIELSEKLSKDIPFVRIDWYEVKDKLYFGEETFYPGSGMEEFYPECYDEELGKMIDLKKVEKRREK